MSVRDRWRRWRNRPKRKDSGNRPDANKQELREFVYLDEVSLRSLLSSLKGDLREGRSEETADEIQGEAAFAVEASNALVGKAEVSSRFQTTNSSTIQTSRKATVQSWFRDFHRIPNLRLVEVAEPKGPAIDVAALVSTEEKSLVVTSAELRRGELVEFRVKLSADPIYHLSTMVSEFSGMAKDFPDMFAANNSLRALQDVQPINKILERLLAGLVPIRAVAIDYSVVTIDGAQYVAHNDLLQGLNLSCEQLQIVGITEHLAYWKDLRRVLFSDAEFTLLGRVARTGLQPSWTPVKLADLFQGLVPDMVNQINAAGRIPFSQSEPISEMNPNDEKLALALNGYAAAALAESGQTLEASLKMRLDSTINTLKFRSGTASDQRSAFKEVANLLGDLVGVEIEPSRDLALRDKARGLSGLSLFPSLTSNTPPQALSLDEPEESESEHLLDVEVIAVYW